MKGMMDDQLAREVLRILGLTDAPEDKQQQALNRVEAITTLQVSRVLVDRLTKEQMRRIEHFQDDSRQAWLESNVKGYRTMVYEITLHVAEGLAAI